MSPLLLALGAYVLVQLGIGVWVSRRIRTEKDYLIAGHSLPFPMVMFSVFATWFGAETVIGAAGNLYAGGLSGGTADPFGYGVCLLVMGAVFAVPLWRRKLITLADVFRQRFSVRVERLAVVLMVPASLLWAAAQIRAFGQVVAVTGGLELQVTITIAAAVVAMYTVFGGLLADAYTDLIQGIVLLGGLIILAVVVFGAEGWEPLAALEPGRLRLFDLGERGVLDVVESWAIPIAGSVLAAELVSRVIAARSPEMARRGTLTAGVLYLTIGMIPVSIGLIGPQLVPGLAFGEQVLPAVAQQYLPPFLFVMFAGALISAILSTVDSALLVASGLVSHNLIVPLRPQMSEERKILIARGGVLLFAGVAYVMALHAEGVYALVEQASAFGSAGIFISLAIGIFSRFGGAVAAGSAIVGGAAAWILGAYVLDLPQPYITSLAVALMGYLGGAAWEKVTVMRDA